MKYFKLALVSVCFAPISAYAEMWSGAEGVCGDWRTAWDMTANGQSYSGSVHGDQVRASCTGGGGIFDGTVTATISGDKFYANRVTTPDNNTCNFSGFVNGKNISGTYTCSNGGPYNFSLKR